MLPKTGSGKTGTMGTVYGDGGEIRIISQVMETIFKKIESLKHREVFTLTRG